MGERMKVAAALVALAIATVPTAVFAKCYEVNFAPLGAKLDEEMTEAQVATALGYTPTAVSLSTCGQESKGGEWSCKIEVFGDACSGSMTVLFYKNKDGVWAVNSWHAIQPTGF
jgi:hypothetical protein